VTAPTGSSDPAPRHAWRSPLAWIVLLFASITGVTADLCLKQWAFHNVAPQPVVLDRDVIQQPSWHIPPHEAVPVIPRVLSLHLVKNEGAVFGIGANQRMFFIVFTIGALAAAVVVFARWTRPDALAAHIAIGLIVAGGVGNLFDRLRFGFVRDFLHLLPGWRLPFGLNWPGGNSEVFPWVFNLADVMLLVGMATLMWYMNSLEKRRKIAGEARAVTNKPPEPPAQPESA